MFLRNYWYVAGYDHEIGSKPLGRIILGEPVVLYRLEDGTVVALEDRCAHRHLPLSMGKLVGDTLECHYHGLRYEELCTLTVGSIHQRESVPHVRVEGKGDTVRYLPLHVTAQLLYRLRPRGIARLRQRGVGTLV